MIAGKFKLNCQNFVSTQNLHIFKFSVKMPMTIRERASKHLPQLQNERRKLEEEFQALLSEFDENKKENKQRETELLARRAELESRATEMIKQIDSLDSVALTQINRFTGNPFVSAEILHYLPMVATILGATIMVYMILLFLKLVWTWRKLLSWWVNKIQWFVKIKQKFLKNS